MRYRGRDVACASPTASTSTSLGTEIAARGPSSRRCAALTRRADAASGAGEAHDAVLALLDDAAVGDEQVGVAEHLRQREVGLRHRDVAPQRLRDLERRARPLGDQAARSCRRGASCMRKRSSISATWSATGSPWPGRMRSTSSIARVARSDSR